MQLLYFFCLDYNWVLTACLQLCDVIYIYNVVKQTQYGYDRVMYLHNLTGLIAIHDLRMN